MKLKVALFAVVVLGAGSLNAQNYRGRDGADGASIGGGIGGKGGRGGSGSGGGAGGRGGDGIGGGIGGKGGRGGDGGSSMLQDWPPAYNPRSTRGADGADGASIGGGIGGKGGRGGSGDVNESSSKKEGQDENWEKLKAGKAVTLEQLNDKEAIRKKVEDCLSSGGNARVCVNKGLAMILNRRDVSCTKQQQRAEISTDGYTPNYYSGYDGQDGAPGASR